jgi:hypothetical protein
MPANAQRFRAGDDDRFLQIVSADPEANRAFGMSELHFSAGDSGRYSCVSHNNPTKSAFATACEVGPPRA